MERPQGYPCLEGSEAGGARASPLGSSSARVRTSQGAQTSGMVKPEELPTFGRYKILNLLGKGGTARVYRAVRSGQMGFGKEVALKVIDPEATADEEAALSLINEARLGGLLRHRNIVEIDDFEKVDGTFYIAMEFIDGWALERVLTALKNKKKMIPPTIVLKIMQEICEGLHYAHDRADRDGNPLNIIHRDLKPGNVMVSRSGEVKIADFGTAKANTNVKKTAVGFTRGTPAYMSPEQVAGEPLDRRSDIFALGGILYELVTLKMVFPGDNMFAVMRRVLDGDTADAVEKMSQISPDLARIMARCMAPEVVDRYQTAKEIADDLATVSRTLKPGPSIAEFLKDAMRDTASTKTGEFGGDLVQKLRNEVPGIGPSRPAEPVDVRAQTIQPDEEFQAPEPMSQIESGAMAPLDDYDDVFAPSLEYSMEFDHGSQSDMPGDPDLLDQFGMGAVAPSPPPPPPAERPRSLLSKPGARAPEPFASPTGDLPLGAMAPLTEDNPLPPPPPQAPPPRPPAPPPAPSGPGAAPGSPNFDASMFSLQTSDPGAPVPRRERPPPRSRPGEAPPPPRTQTSAERSRSWQKSLAAKKRRDGILQIAVLAMLAGGGFWLFGSPGGFAARQAQISRMISSFTGGAGGARVNAAFVDVPGASLVLGEKGEQNAGESRAPIDVPGFAMMKNEVTVRQYRTGCVQRPFGMGCRGWDGGESFQGDDHPVVNVTWEDANGFCEGQGWSLPTEAQWEMAARGAERRKYPWGDEVKMKAMNYCDRGCDEAGLPHTNEDDGFPQTSPVGRFKAGASAQGINDLSGNASEWAKDCWVQNHFKREDWTAAEKRSCRTRAVRGGSWKETVHAQAAYRRTPAVATTRSEKIGFRCVKNVPPAAAP